jgi:hypothetical protein
MHNFTKFFKVMFNYFLKIFLILLVTLLNGQAVQAATVTWTGNSSTDWTTASNWSGGVLPGDGDDVVIPTSPSGGNMPVFSTGSVTINKLTVQAGATLTQTGGTMLAIKPITISGVFDQQGGTFLTDDHIKITSGGEIIQSGSAVIHLALNLARIPNKDIVVDGGLAETEGTVSVHNLDIKNGAMYKQTDGEIEVNFDFKNNAGNTFLSTGGTVRFKRSAGPAARFLGNIQFHNVVVEDGVDPKFDNGGGSNIKISGNYTNNNPNLNVTKSTFTFNGWGDQTIFSASAPLPAKTTFGNLVIDKPSGSIKLMSDVAVNTYTDINNLLDLNGYILWVNGVPLPVELSAFSAIVLDNAIKLYWKTETEVNNYGFEVQRAKGGLNFEMIGFVQGHGNTNSPKEYSFIDEQVTAGKYSYRLKQIDTDGKFEYSKVIEIEIGSPGAFELSQNYPNPFNPVTTIRYSLPQSGNVRLTVYNLLGEQVEVPVNEFKEAGVHTINFKAENLNSGIYIYKLETEGFVRSRKMTLIK